MNTSYFDSIQLKEMSRVKLMNRTDRKYWFHYDQLEALLRSISEDYYILNIDGQSNLPYATTYYDTEKNKMFIDHQNGKLNRFKVRRRSYVASGISFLEVKFKSNKGRTIKKRIPAEYGNSWFTQAEYQFLTQTIPFSCLDLEPSLYNRFTRLTLVNKNFKERCTIDLDLQFENAERKVNLDQLVIVEIKSEGYSAASSLAMALRDHRIKSSGFSKYCIGRTVTDPTLKRNAFKRKIRSIQKTIHTNNSLYILN